MIESSAKRDTWQRTKITAAQRTMLKASFENDPNPRKMVKTCLILVVSGVHSIRKQISSCCEIERTSRSIYALSTGIGFRLWRSLLEKLGYLRKWLEFGFKTSAQGRRGSMGASRETKCQLMNVSKVLEKVISSFQHNAIMSEMSNS